jgi:hypothetical protein
MSDGDFDSERAKKEALENAWEVKREQTLKEFGLWEKYKDGDPEFDND